MLCDAKYWPQVQTKRKRRTTEAVALTVALLRGVLEPTGRYGPDRPAVMRIFWKDGNLGIEFLRNVRPLFYGGPPAVNWEWRVEIEIVQWPVWGERWFLRCARCNRRCEAVYIVSHCGTAHCRICQRLAYPSTQKWDNVKRTGFSPGICGRLERALAEGRLADAKHLVEGLA